MLHSRVLHLLGRLASAERDASRPLPALTRRALLGAGAATMLGSCTIGRSLFDRGRARDADVVVVGAGLAGLTCAHRLKKAGVRVRLLEAQGRLGGRILTLRDFFPDGRIVDLGGEFVSSGDERLRTLAGELGVALDDLGEEMLLDPLLWHFEGRARSTSEVIAGLAPIAAAARRDLARRTSDGPVYYRDPNGLEPVDDVSLAQWLDRVGASGWVRRLVDVAWTAEFGVEPAEQSALNLVLGLDESFVHSGTRGDRRYRIRGGADRLVDALARGLSNEIETGSVVEAIRELPSWSWTVTARRNESTVELDATHLVLAIPFPLLREIDVQSVLPPIKRYAIDNLRSGTQTKLGLGFETQAWRTMHGERGSVVSDLGFQTAWEAETRAGARGGVLAVQAGGERGARLGSAPLAAQAEDVLGGLDLVYPGLATVHERGRAARLPWAEHPRARGGRSVYAPHQWTLFGGVQRERIERLHFAGEHTSYAAQGTMEGAVESGERVAREILES